jgi:hypothetical protein
LRTDKYFREIIESDKEGFVDLQAFLSCRKVLAKGINKGTDLVGVMTNSQKLELSPCKTKIRRKGNKALPERKEKFIGEHSKRILKNQFLQPVK